MSLNRTQIVDWLYRCGDIFTKESDFLTGLDKEIGDADHGLNMHRGFSKVVEKLPSIADKDIGFILKNTGMTLPCWWRAHRSKLWPRTRWRAHRPCRRPAGVPALWR